jgi:hypothetical protein
MSGLALAQQALNFYQSIVSLKSIIQSWNCCTTS